MKWSDYVKQNSAPTIFKSDESWAILTETERNIKQKIEAIGTPLEKWDIRINYGIKTGCNEAFIISGAVKDRLIEEDARSAEIIRPILRGKDIKRYGHNFKDLWLITAHNGYVKDGSVIPPIDIENYPAVKRHLDLYWEVIKDRGDQGCTPYNLRNCAYMDDFSKQKIAWGNLCLKAQFALVQESVFINAPSPLITPGYSWLLAYLNSAIADWYIRLLGVTRNGGYFEYKPMFIEKLPIPALSEEQKNFLESHVAKIIGTGGSCIEAEEEIDDFLFDLFELTDSEKNFFFKPTERSVSRRNNEIGTHAIT